MSKELFTPGDWFVNDEPGFPLTVERIGETDGETFAEAICEIKPTAPMDVARADAHLMAASKDMYAALQNCLYQLETFRESNAWGNGDQKACEIAEAALLKAEGGTKP